MNECSELASDHHDGTEGQRTPRPNAATLQEDIEMSSGSSGNETNENDFSGRESPGSDENGKDSAMLVESSESHKSSSNAFSLMIVNSDHNPSTSGCSEQSAKAKTQKELIKTLKELKGHLPPDRKTKGKPSMLATLKYALRSIKQIKANEEYYQLLMTSENHSADLDVPSYTVKEIEMLTSEYIVKNVDMFAMAVSLVTGKIVYVSDQAASILPCKKDAFHDAKFVEFLAPHDVSVFHSSTAPSRLPAWSVCRRADSSAQDYMEEKSFFCRISGGKDHENVIRYHPFRMTPYLARIQEKHNTETQLCCVLLAEKVHSGYEAPRIPPDKRIFTTTHTPNCLFQEVDERAVPLLGYLPQDLIGTPILVHLHPRDRPLMLAIHKKILQYGGQPFDYSPIRFCTRNGEYITMDTSWSSFINPWNRKVSFIIGRHKVRTGPLNEDVFAAHSCMGEKTPHPSIQEITQEIYRLLLQPVHNSGSSGYGSLGSNGSHEHLMSQTSSSDSNGQLHEDARKRKPNTRKGVCKDAQKIPSKSALVYENGEEMRKPAAESQNSPNAQTREILAMERGGLGPSLQKSVIAEELACRSQSVYSYQQISCLDSVIRYLESCSVAGPLKRKCESLPGTTPPLLEDEQKPPTEPGQPPSAEETSMVKVPLNPAVLKTSKANAHPVVGAHLTSLALPGKAESVVSFTSQCSYSSTLVHVGDKKLQPESEMIEDPASGMESLDSAAAPSSHCDSSPDKGPPKKVGLTKEVLAVHTQKEEQSFLHRFKETRRLSTFQSRCHYYLQERSKGRPGERAVRGLRTSISGMDSSWKKNGKNRKQKSKRIKPHESSDSTTSGTNVPPRSPLVGLNSTAWSPSDTSQASCPPASFPTVVPAYPLPVFPSPGVVPASGNVSSTPQAPQAHLNDSGNPQNYISLQPPAFTAPLTPVMAVVLPTYTFPPVTPNGHPSFYSGQSNCPQHPACSTQMVFAAQPEFPVQASFSSQTLCPTQSFHYQSGERERPPAPGAPEGPSRSSTPQSTGRQDQASPPLFQSRCSSPLQLNLLQLEETPKAAESTVAAVSGSLGGRGLLSEGPNNKPVEFEDGKRPTPRRVDSPMDAHHSDALSLSSDFLEILLAEDGCSATGSASSGSGASAASESLGSGSLGCSASRTGTGSSETSHTSKYFGSVDSSENSHRAKLSAGLPESEHFLKCVLQDPIWLLMANTDNDIMMTYQLPSRNLETVLKEDREKLKLMQKFQPKFADEQKRELHEVHTWMPRGGLPRALNLAECPDCEGSRRDRVDEPYDEDVPAMDLSEMMETQGEKSMCPAPCGTKEET
ncbi:period circadian protein homolog 2 isoform X3 [Dromiciops gliroides]|uniref:period circadian protein homolog 2 isoform X3 n=1 Tax=Dromiciops gliroides TaxID=33562 RepID=UPI001CC7A557|nr:period circadian protein homolog 2 isoform X3 [Dromiciops gliroides]